MFHSADVIMAPHGAGLLHVLFAKPGTVVIEVHCKGHDVHMSFRLMAHRLGMRYYVMETTSDDVSFRCNKSGVYADIDELEVVLNSIAENL